MLAAIGGVQATPAHLRRGCTLCGLEEVVPVTQAELGADRRRLALIAVAA